MAGVALSDGTQRVRVAAAGSGGAVLAIGEAASRVIAFAATLIVARRLGPEAFGLIGVATGILLYLQQIADQGIELVGATEVATQRDTTVVGALASSVLTRRVVAAGVLAAVVGLASRWVLPDPDGRVLAAYAPVLVFTGASVRWILLGMGRTGAIVIARAVGEVTGLILVAVLVRSATQLLLVPAAAVAGIGVTTLLMLGAVRRAGVSVKPALRWAEGGPLFHRGRALVVFTLLGLVLYNFDLIFLRFVKGEAAAGLYAAGYAFISFASNLAIAYAHAVMPGLARAATDAAERDRAYGVAVVRAATVVIPAALGAVYVASPLLDTVFGSRFLDGAVALRWLAVSLPLAVLRELAVVAVVAAGAERRLVRVNAITVGANVLLNLVLVPRLGLVGAAQATLLTEAIRLGLAWRLAASSGFRAPPVARFGKALAAAAVMAGALTLGGPAPLWRSLAVGGVTFGLTLFSLGGLKFRRGVPEIVG